MTTIACNKYMLAGDKQFTYGGNLKMLGKSKIFELPPESSQAVFNAQRAFVGLCGAANQFGPSLEWLFDPSGKPPKVKGVEFLLLTSNKEIYHAENLTNWMKVDDPFFAIGSGMSYAIAAMACGKDPYEAVKVASKLDPMTGKGFNKLVFE